MSATLTVTGDVAALADGGGSASTLVAAASGSTLASAAAPSTLRAVAAASIYDWLLDADGGQLTDDADVPLYADLIGVASTVEVGDG